MACENDKCDKYGLHHDYKDGVEMRKCFSCERDEQDIALSFYRTMLNTLKTEGVEAIILTLEDGKMVADARIVGDEKKDEE